MNGDDPIAAGIQEVLNSYGDGWTVASYIVAIGVERVSDDGVENTEWVESCRTQPVWVTRGLVHYLYDWWSGTSGGEDHGL